MGKNKRESKNSDRAVARGNAGRFWQKFGGEPVDFEQCYHAPELDNGIYYEILVLIDPSNIS